MNPCFRLFAVLLVFAVSPVRAETAENPDFLRGDTIYQNGKGDAAGFQDALGAFKLAAEKGHTRAQYFLGRMYHLGHGVAVNLVTALQYYHKTLEQQPDYPSAWSYIGQIHESGGPGVTSDLKAAEAAYLSGVRASEDNDCYYRLYLLYSAGKLPPGDKPAFSYLVKAAELGNITAARRAAECYREGSDGVNKDPVETAHFYDLAAQNNDLYSIYFLVMHAHDTKLIEHYGLEATQAWEKRWNTFKDLAHKEAAEDLTKIRPVFEAGDEAGARSMLEQALKRWNERTKNRHASHTETLWTEAQTQSGRTNLEWGCFLFAWLTDINRRDGDSEAMLGAQSSLNGTLNRLGRYGRFRDSCTEMKRLIHEVEGIDVDAVLKSVSVNPDYTVAGVEKIPLLVNVEGAKRSRSTTYNERISPGDMIGGRAIWEMLNLANERMSVGDWQSALVFTEWIARWSDKLTAEKKKLQRGFPGCQEELLRRPDMMKANIFYSLGLPKMGAAAYQKAIDMKLDKNLYGGRIFHHAQCGLAEIQIDQGDAGKVDLVMIKTVEDEMRANKYDDSHAWQFARLVRARVLAEVEGIDVARPIVSEVLASSLQGQRPLLRLEALLVSANLELKAGNTEGVVGTLEEALSWARGQGLLFMELRIDELYVTYLIKIGDYDQALAMQRRVLELIDALQLSPRRARAILRYAEIYGLRRDSTTALALLKEIKDPSLGAKVKTLEAQLRQNETGAPAVKPVTLEQVDLQPMGIQSMPLRKDAEAVFILTNPNPGTCTVELTVESELFGLTREEPSGVELVIQGKPSTNVGSHRLDVKIDVPGAGQFPITLAAEGLGSLEQDATVTLQAKSSGTPAAQKSAWLIQPKGSEVQVAVVDAAKLKNNAFCLIPVYHHLDSLDGAQKSAALRVVASEPTRVEGYATDGTLLFVDAQGNGSFRDPGDLIATPEMNDLFPVVTADAENGRIALRYRPKQEGSNRRVELRIETRMLGEKNAWTTDAIDWLEP